MTSNGLAVAYGQGAVAAAYFICGVYLWHTLARHRRALGRWCAWPSRHVTMEPQDSVWKAYGLSPCCFFRQKAAWDPCEKKVRELATKHQVFLHGHLLGYISHIAVLMLLLFASKRAFEVWSDKYKGEEPFSDPLNLSACLALVGLAAASRPGVMTARRMDILHVLLMARLMWQVLLTSSAHRLALESQGITACRIGFGLWHGNLPLILILNLLYSCASSWKYIFLIRSCESCAHDFGPQSDVCYVMDSFLVTLVVTTFAYSIEFSTLKEARARVQATLSSQAETTVNTLLMALCDAVIRLCGNFRITHGARALETLLLRASGSLVATSFLDVLEESDRARFHEHIEGNRNMTDGGPAALLHVHARDSNGTRVSLQIFTAHFADLNGNAGHLLGVLELSREEYGLPEGVDLNIQSLDMMQQLRFNGPAIRSPSSTSPSFLPLAQPGASLDEVMIWFDAASLVVLQTTPACTTIAGPSCEGTDLRDWLVNPDAFIQQVRVYCQTLVDLCEDDNHGIPRLQIQGVKLQPPIALRAQIQYVTDITFTVDEENLSDSDTSCNLILRAAFTNISQRHGKKKRQAQRHLRQPHRSAQDTQHDSECSSSGEPGIDGPRSTSGMSVFL